MRVLLALRVYSSIIMYPAQNRFYFLINRFIWDCILLVLPNKAVNFLFAQNLRHWVPLWFIDNTSDSGVLYRFVQRLINLPNGYEGNEKKSVILVIFNKNIYLSWQYTSRITRLKLSEWIPPWSSNTSFERKRMQ